MTDKLNNFFATILPWQSTDTQDKKDSNKNTENSMLNTEKGDTTPTSENISNDISSNKKDITPPSINWDIQPVPLQIESPFLQKYQIIMKLRNNQLSIVLIKYWNRVQIF